jgi:hypothetical protein
MRGIRGNAAPEAAGLALAVLLAIPLAACRDAGGPEESARVVTADAAARMIRGTWELVEGCGGIVYTCRSAPALPEPTRYEFGATTVDAYRDGRRVFTTEYRILPGSAPHEGDERPQLVIGGEGADPRPLLVSFTGAAGLLLDEGCCDRYTFRYTRR